MEYQKTVTYRIQRQNEKGNITTIRSWASGQEGRPEWREQDLDIIKKGVNRLRTQFKKDGYIFWIEKIVRITKITTVKEA